MLRQSVLSLVFGGLIWSPTAQALDTAGAVKATPVLQTSESWDGTALSYPEGEAEISGMIVEIAVGGETGWHLHPVPSFGMVLEGELEVRLRDGKSNRFKAGDTLAEVVNTEHNGRNVGNVPLKLLVFYAGAKGKERTVKSAVP
ncbi:MAG: cupin domain-containing protein [Ahniella sp.]|nr:cupin domain-containing protein [Ahniella sp.]